MADYPDVLDRLGKTPREFGAVQVHAEPVGVDDGWGWTTISFQAAFEPMDPLATFEVVTVGPSPRRLGEAQRVPPLDGGRVMQGRVRFKLADEVAQVVVRVTGGLPRGATRCRPPWKLFDTFEIAKESEMRAPPSDGIDFSASAVGSLLGTPFSVGVFSWTRGGNEATPLERSVRGTMHKAQQLPDGFPLEVLRDSQRPQPAGDAFAPLWVPGQPLPERPAVVLALKPAAAPSIPSHGRKECGRCGFSGKYADYGGDRHCPECGDDWR